MASTANAWQDYREQGWKKGWSPHPLFDVAWYLKHNPKVAEEGVEPLSHYLDGGWKKGASPHPLFDTKWYLRRNPDVAANGVEPLQHYLTCGWKEHRSPHPRFNGRWYLEENPDVEKLSTAPLLHYVTQGWKQGKNPNEWFNVSSYMETHHLSPEGNIEPLANYIELNGPGAGDLTSAMVLREHYGPDTEALRLFVAPTQTRRINLVTDSIALGSLFGGVGTALVMAVLLAKRMDCALRIITRIDPPRPRALHETLEAHRLDWKKDVEFVHLSPGHQRQCLDVSDQDFFLTSSWWTTLGALQSVPAAKIIYLVQEDERMFYAEGDTKRRCSQLMSDPRPSFVVNTHLLQRHLVLSGLSHFEENARAFEPAFPAFTGHQLKQEFGTGKRNFFFYARPNHPRNLFGLGMEVIEAALEQRLLPPEEWQLHFVGHGLEPLSFPGGMHPTIHQHLTWTQYVQLAKTVDLGLSLMYTPHPSYPPLDLAIGGAAVVTNTFGIKRSLETYSKNIICGEPTIEGLLDALKIAIPLANDLQTRRANMQSAHIGMSWESSFHEVLEWICTRLEGALPASR